MRTSPREKRRQFGDARLSCRANRGRIDQDVHQILALHLRVPCRAVLRAFPVADGNDFEGRRSVHRVSHYFSHRAQQDPKVASQFAHAMALRSSPRLLVRAILLAHHPSSHNIPWLAPNRGCLEVTEIIDSCGPTLMRVAARGIFAGDERLAAADFRVEQNAVSSGNA